MYLTNSDFITQTWEAVSLAAAILSKILEK